MRRLRAPRAIFGLSLALLLAVGGPSGKMASAQETESSVFDAEAPITSLLRASPETDSQLADLATSLLKARAETEISHSTYQEGVRYFRLNHPQFYGNFFGHPYYATYDVHYLQMARYRSLASVEADPLTGLPGLFFCNPAWYDPAFGGDCEGFLYTSSEFLILPSGFSPSRSTSSPCSETVAEGFCMQPVDLARLIESNAPDNPRHSDAHYDTDNQEQRGTVGDPPLRDIPPGMEKTRPPEGAHKTTRTSSTNASPPSPSVGGGERAKAPERIEQTRPPVRRIKIPADVDASLQRKASSLKRTEAKLRLRRQIQQKYGGREHLSPRERARLTSRLGETTYLDGERDGASGRSDGEHADVPVGNHGDSGVPQETASRSMNIERTIGRLAREADRSNSDPSGSSTRPNIDLPNADRPKLPRPVDLPDLKRANLPEETPDAPSASGPNGTPDLDPPKRERKRRIEPEDSGDSGGR